MAVLLLTVFFFLAVFAKVFTVMIVQGSELQLKAVSQWMRDVPTEAPRGKILDRNGVVLADTATRYNIYVRPNAVKDKEAVARLLAQVFGYTYEDALKRFPQARRKSRLRAERTKNSWICCMRRDLRVFITAKTISVIIRSEIL